MQAQEEKRREESPEQNERREEQEAHSNSAHSQSSSPSPSQNSAEPVTPAATPADQPAVIELTLHSLPPLEALHSRHGSRAESLSSSCGSTVLHAEDVYASLSLGVTQRLDPASSTQQEDVRSSASAACASPAQLSASPSVDSRGNVSLPAAPSWLLDLRSAWQTASPPEPEPEPEPSDPPDPPPLHPAIAACPALDGDIVWRTDVQPRRMTVLERDEFLRASKYASYRLQRATGQMTSMFLPVCLLALCLLLYAWLLDSHDSNPHRAREAMLYVPAVSHSSTQRFEGGMRNGAVVLAAIVALTGMFVALFLAEWTRALRAFLTTVLAVLLAPWLYFAAQALRYYRIPADVLSCLFLALNFYALAYVGLVIRAETASNLNRAFLLAVGVAVACVFLAMDEWSVWAALGLLTVYDLVAVLSPCGPLKFLMSRLTALERSAAASGAQPLPGMLYHGRFFRLGLGDLVFYGVLLARAANQSLVVLVCTAIGVCMGVAGTILWSCNTDAPAVPALPLSVILALALYASSSLAFGEWVEHVIGRA